LPQHPKVKGLILFPSARTRRGKMIKRSFKK
jgi:hypothetical protein